MKHCTNRIWLAYANEERCDHVGAFRDLGYCDWACANAKLSVGDIVYICVGHLPNELKRIRYKTVVSSIDNLRTDSSFWKEPVSKRLTSKLDLLQEYNGTLLDEELLRAHGFIDFYGSSIKLLKEPLLSYVQQVF